MKIAVACIKDEVAEHFGHCEHFKIYSTNDNRIVAVENVLNPKHKPGFLPVFLKRHEIDVILSGSMGSGAMDLFTANSITTVTGVQGTAQTAVEQYLHGNLKSTGSACHQHQHHADCGH